MAASDRGVLVPVRFDQAKLPIDFRAVQTIDLDDWDENTDSESFQRIRRVLASTLGSSLALGIGAMLAKTHGPHPGYITAGMPGDGAVTPAAGAAVVTDQSIAVLPFVDRSSDAEQEYFSDGISEELLNLLAKIPELRVISRSSAFSFKGKPEAALEAFARESDEEYRVKGRALAAYALDREEEYEASLAELIERWGDQWPSEVAHVYAWTGETDRAFEWLARSVAEEDGAFDPQHPMLRPLKNDPRWLPLLESLGKSPAQLQLDAIAFEVTLPGQ